MTHTPLLPQVSTGVLALEATAVGVVGVPSKFVLFGNGSGLEFMDETGTSFVLTTNSPSDVTLKSEWAIHFPLSNLCVSLLLLLLLPLFFVAVTSQIILER